MNLTEIRARVRQDLKDTDSANYILIGLIGEVRIYNRAPRNQEILDHYIIGKEMFG